MIMSDDPSGIESLLKKADFTKPGFSGRGISVIHKLRSVFGGHMSIRDIMPILNENPVLVDELNQIGEFRVHHGST